MESIKPLRIDFEAMEFQADGNFQKMAYAYEGSEIVGWKVFRNHKLHLQLPPGYKLLKTIACGICSTDLSRAQLPFSLPQITGHEVVALDGDKRVVVEINASHFACGEKTECYFCNNGLSNHCPKRLTLGIDRLPGGFSPYILAPKNSIIALPDVIDTDLAVITEPLAAAIRAVEKTPLKQVKSVAVVGPRRLGSLLLLVLNHYRKLYGLTYSLTAIVRTSVNEELCYAAGADEVLYSNKLADRTFEVVFDTSGSTSGFELSLAIAEHIVHLKSTNGQSYQGLDILTDLVINEINMYPATKSELRELLNSKDEILIDRNCLDKAINLNLNKHKIFSVDTQTLHLSKNETGQFDTLIVADLKILNSLFRSESGRSYIKPQGKIFLYKPDNRKSENILQCALIERKIILLTSRCGDFNKAISLILKEIATLDMFRRHFLTHAFDIQEIKKAFQEAGVNSGYVKGVIKFMELSVN